MPDIIPVVTSFISGGIGGAISGAVISHFLAKRRDTASRKLGAKTDALVFLNTWDNHVKTAPSRSNIAKVFDYDRSQLVQHATKLEPIYKGRQLDDFHKLIRSIREITPGDVETEQGYKQLGKAIESITAFIKRN